MKRSLIALAAGLALATGAQAADRLKIGFLSTLSGPAGAIGVEIRDGFNLALKMRDGKLGNLPTEVIIADDQLNPEAGKQTAERMLKRDRVDLMTGVVFSNVMLAVAPAIFANKTFYIAANSTPTLISGSGCNPYFFSASWPNEAYHEAAGQYATSKGYKNVYLIAPNYPAGKDSLTGFKRLYKGNVVAEVYTKLNQLDYSAELAQLRAAKPEAVFIFLPGGMGINFIKQFVAGGLSSEMQLLLPGFVSDQDVIRAVGDSMLGLFDTAHWAYDLDNEANKQFVAAYMKEYNRIPSVFSAQGYDTALLIDAAVRDVKGRIENEDAFRKAIRAARFKSVRGDFKLAHNGTPIQNYYLRTIVKDSQGRIVNKSLGTVLTNHGDYHAKDCKMK